VEGEIEGKKRKEKITQEKGNRTGIRDSQLVVCGGLRNTMAMLDAVLSQALWLS
jgi:hypothetical protein